jgi:hypothetical protein
MSRGWVHLEVEEILKETDNAFLLILRDWEGEFWIPKSQVSDSGDYEEGDVDCTISVTEWIANEKGLT